MNFCTKYNFNWKCGIKMNEDWIVTPSLLFKKYPGCTS